MQINHKRYLGLSLDQTKYNVEMISITVLFHGPVYQNQLSLHRISLYAASAEFLSNWAIYLPHPPPAIGGGLGPPEKTRVDSVII